VCLCVCAASMVLSPFAVAWDGYDEQEQARKVATLVLDAVGIPVFIIWYVVLATAVADANGNGTSDEGPLPVKIFLATAAVFILKLHCIDAPATSKIQDAWMSQAKMGRWIYLTRHCITLQAIHLVLSVMATWSQWLTALTNGMTLWIAGLGWFVTIQFFLLVAPNPGYKEECKIWQSRGVQFKELMHFLHIPSLFLGSLDVLFGKAASGLQLHTSMPSLIVLPFVYVVFYLTIIVVNKHMTGKWAYMFLDEYGHDIGKWTVFVLKQSGILLAFLFANWLLFKMRAVS